MNFFKHFTDAHRGQSMQSLLDELGHTGPCCYWILVEMCADKLSMRPDAGLSESDCKFSFHPRIVRQNLRISVAKLQRMLDICQGLTLLSYDLSENSLNISMPKLLESLDRDAKRARQTRAKPAAKSGLEEEVEEEVEVEVEAHAPPPVKKEPPKIDPGVLPKPEDLVALKPWSSMVLFNDNARAHPETEEFRQWLSNWNYAEPKLAQNASAIMHRFNGFGPFAKWIESEKAALEKLKLSPAEQRKRLFYKICDTAQLVQPYERKTP